MTTDPAHPVLPQEWRAELASLLAQPVAIEEGVYLEGERIGLRITPILKQEQDTADLLLSLFFLNLAPRQETETDAYAVALHDYVADLRHEDYHLRMAACRALGQLGEAQASDALHNALRDENRYVRVMAAQALAMLEQLRSPKEALGGVRFLLWQPVRHLWKPFLVVQTNQRGQARLTAVRTDFHYKLQLLSHAVQEKRLLVGPTEQEPEEFALAAAEAKTELPLLPPPQQLILDVGVLYCTFYRDDQEQLILEFRSDAKQFHEAWVHVRVVRQSTQEEVVQEFVELRANARGICVGQYVFDEQFDLTSVCEVFFEPLSLPPTEG